MGHESSSESELDCSAIVGASDSDDSSTPGCRVFDRLQSEKSSATSGSSDQTAQTLVNQKILEQLTTIGKRLDALESNKCKKSSDKSKIKNKKGKVGQHKVPLSAQAQSADTVLSQSTSTVPSVSDTQTNIHSLPSLSSIRQNANIQQQVDQRIHELSLLAKTGTDAKLKSQRGGGGVVEVYIKKKVKWPHEYVLGGVNKERISYDQLTMGQWMTGFCRTMRDESDPKNRACMLDYLIALLLMVVMTSHGRRPSPAMLSFYVAWSKVRLQIFHVLTKLIELGGLMLRGMLLVTRMQINFWPRNLKPPNPCHANFSMLVLVSILKHMKPKVCYTNMFVRYVSPKMAKIFHIQRPEKTNRQKTSSGGHVFES